MKSQDLTGAKFGRLTVVERAPFKGKSKWRCSCECGGESVVYATHLLRGRTVSCGCRLRENQAALKPAQAKHGMWKTSEFNIWSGMLKRCHSPGDKGFSAYGGRGITVCDQWRDDFKAFYDHIGPRPSKRHSVDRIENDKGYEPGNVRWATPEEQQRNRGVNVRAEVCGEVLTAAEISQRFGLSETAVLRRIHRGLTGADLVSPPKRLKLSAEDAEAIRMDARSGVEVAAVYGVGKSQVSAIRRGKSWKR